MSNNIHQTLNFSLLMSIKIQMSYLIHFDGRHTIHGLENICLKQYILPFPLLKPIKLYITMKCFNNFEKLKKA